jgi:hypothetical protein
MGVHQHTDTFAIIAGNRKKDKHCCMKGLEALLLVRL